MAELLIVTEDGYGRRVRLGEIKRMKDRGRVGVKLSRWPIAAALVVDARDTALIITTAAGKVVRVAVAQVPLRQRIDSTTGRMPKGLRLIRLAPGDRVTALACMVEPPAAWPGGRVGLTDGESTAQVRVLHPLAAVEDLELGGEPAVDREAWSQTDVHRRSRYWCVHCGSEQRDPAAVYECIDSHAEAQEVAA